MKRNIALHSGLGKRLPWLFLIVYLFDLIAGVVREILFKLVWLDLRLALFDVLEVSVSKGLSPLIIPTLLKESTNGQKSTLEGRWLELWQSPNFAVPGAADARSLFYNLLTKAGFSAILNIASVRGSRNYNSLSATRTQVLMQITIREHSYN